jgi:hypothetical protein
MYTAFAIISLAKSNPFFRAAIESDPDYLQAVALRDKVLATERELGHQQSTQAPIPVSPDDDLAAWLDDVARADALEREQAARVNALRSLRVRTEAEIVSRISGDPNWVLRHLREDFDTLMADTDQVVAHLDGATTPAAAIAAGVADYWHQLSALRHSYDQLRVAQRGIMVHQEDLLRSCKTPNFDDELANDSAIANLDDVFPQWRQPPQLNIDNTLGVPVPWPADPVEQLVWLCTSDAQPWLPTLSDLHALHAEQRKRRNPPPADTNQPQPRQTDEPPLIDELPLIGATHA